MCVINGFNWDDENLIKDMNRVSINRVLDNHGSHTDKNISSDNVKLLIINLSEKGHQPLVQGANINEKPTR